MMYSSLFMYCLQFLTVYTIITTVNIYVAFMFVQFCVLVIWFYQTTVFLHEWDKLSFILVKKSILNEKHLLWMLVATPDKPLQPQLIEGNGQEPGKVLCCMFSLAILGVDPAQNLAKYKRWLCVLIQITNRSIVTR